MVEALDRREEILEAAFEEFAAKGYKGATIKSIAGAAGLQSPALTEDGLTDEEHLETAVNVFLGGLRTERSNSHDVEGNRSGFRKNGHAIS